MFLERFEQVQLGVLLDLNTQIVQLFDRSVAGQEVQRTRTEADDLQVRQSDDSACDRARTHGSSTPAHSFSTHSTGYSGTYAFTLRSCQVVAGVQHAAVSISTTAGPDRRRSPQLLPRTSSDPRSVLQAGSRKSPGRSCQDTQPDALQPAAS